MRTGNIVAGATGTCALAGFLLLGGVGFYSTHANKKPPGWTVPLGIALFLPGVCASGVERVIERWGLSRPKP